MVLNGLGKGTENNPQLRQLLLERRRHRHAIEHRIDGDAGHEFLFFQGDPEFVEGRLDFEVDLVKAVQPGLLLRRGVIHDGLIVDRGEVNVVPGRLRHRLPEPVRLEPPLQHPLGLVFLFRDRPDDVLAESGRDLVAFDVGDEAVPDPRFAGSSMV